MRVKKDSKKIKKLKHKARRKSIKEGIYASIKNAFGDKYISPFAIAINASNSIVVLLSAIIGLLGPFGQTLGSKLMWKQNRKKIITRNLIKESLSWLLFGIIAILYYKDVIREVLPFFLLIAVAIYIIFANMVHPAYFSWTGDIVDKKYRGRWFSKRILICNFMSIIATIGAAIFLDLAKNKGWPIIGFVILFLLASATRFKTYAIFKKQYYPRFKEKRKDYFSFWDFLKKSRKTNFGKFALFRASLGFAGTISSPFVAIYLLRTLKFDYTSYMTIILSSIFFMILVLKIWGKFSDKFGNYKILLITTIFIPLIPILWVLCTSKLYLVFVPALISGISWAGFNLAEKAYIYDNVSKEKRGLAISYYNMLWGIGVFAGAVTGAILIKIIKTSWVEPIILIFMIGAIARMIVIFFGINRIKEVRKTQKFKGLKSLENIFFHESRASLIEEAYEIKAIPGYLKER